MTDTTKNGAYVPSSSLFAKLLSNENLKVAINTANKTATFDPKNRVLTLPNWQGFESDAWYMFIAHEVGHALFTPVTSNNDPFYVKIRTKYGVTQSQIDAVMNVLEDIRIERRVRVKYRGLDGFFSKGYRQLLARDFFGLGDSSKIVSSGLWDHMKTLDKLNLYSKVGGLLDLKLTDANHIRWYNQALRCDTFAEVQALAEDIIKTIKESQQNKNDQSEESEESDENSKDEKSQNKKDKSKDKKDKNKDKSKDKKDKKDKNDEKSGRTDKPNSDLEDRDEDDPREKPEESDDNESEGAEEESDENSGESETDEDEEGDSDEGDSEEGDESGPDDAESEGEGSDEGDENESESGSEGDEDGESDDSGNTDADMSGEESEGEGEGSDEGQSEGDADGDTDGDTDGNEQEGKSSGGSKSADTTYADSDLSADTQSAANKTLEGAAGNPYSRSKRHILPVDFKFLNSGAVDLKSVIAAWRADANAKLNLRNAVASYKRQSSTTLASMVSTFRANQAANVARKVQVSKTGTIDPVKLSGYKIVEDIFLRRQTITKGQNHGFVINIDWSGSMRETLPTVLWQTLNLIWFAETLRIPIEVYCFSDSASSNYGADPAVLAAVKARGEYGYNLYGHQVQLYSSAAPVGLKNDAQAHFLAMIYMFAGAFYHSYGYSNSTIPTFGNNALPNLPEVIASDINQVFSGFRTYQSYTSAFNLQYASLGGTPLHNAMFASIPQILDFRVKNRVEKCISVWLTDGDNTSYFHASHPAVAIDVVRASGDCGVFTSPLTGKDYDSSVMFPAAIPLQHHKDATGATVVVLDLCYSPEISLGRYMSRANINAALGKNKTRPGQFRALVNGKTKMEQFTTSGILVVEKKDCDALPCDAIIVTDPAAWVDGNGNKYATAAANDVAKAVTDDSGLDKNQSNRLANVVRKNMGAVAMRRFADMLVPFLAKGEV